jgi:hypothetical protein
MEFHMERREILARLETMFYIPKLGMAVLLFIL